MPAPNPESASALLKSFDPRPLHKRAKFVLTLVGALALLLLGALEILRGHGAPEVLERVVTWLGLTVGIGTGGIALDDARTKPILAQALERVVAPADARPPEAR